MGIARLLAAFPRLSERSDLITSPATTTYNCIAWAAGDTSRWWWPDQHYVGFWPEGARREETEEAFVVAYGTLGYRECDSADLDPDTEKVAIYSIAGVPAHAARQLSDGLWTSKLGDLEDIRHELEELEGQLYGQVSRILSRTREIG